VNVDDLVAIDTHVRADSAARLLGLLYNGYG